MTVWLLTVLLLASVAALGFRQGIVRVAFSFAGIVMGGLLGALFGRALKPLLGVAGIKNPLILWLGPPCIIFIIVLVIFKIVGFTMNRKVDVYFKHKAGDLRLALWERLDHRLGLCLGLFNGTAYLLLLSVIIFTLSYWTFQMSSDADPKYLRVINRLGEDLQNTGFSRVARALDRAPVTYYDAADIAGLLYRNPLLSARVSRYPALLNLGERPEFQALANDKDFEELQMKQAPLMQMLNHSAVQGILNSPDALNAVRDALVPNFADMKAYLETGQSAKFDSEKILGRWNFDVNGTLMLVQNSRTNIPSGEMLRLRKWMAASFAQTTLTATIDQRVIVKNLPHIKVVAPGKPPMTEVETATGQWKNNGGKYSVMLTSQGKPEEMVVEIQGDRMSLAGGTQQLAFTREN